MRKHPNHLMDQTIGLVVIGVAVLVGLVGVVVPLMPGALVVLGAIAVWAVDVGDFVAWTTLAVAAALIGASQVLKYLVPGRRMRDSGVPTSSLVAGGLLGIVGFFVIPVVGLVVGFVGGIYLAEVRRTGATGAWASTKRALGAVGLSMLIELAGALLAAAVWAGVAILQQ